MTIATSENLRVTKAIAVRKKVSVSIQKTNSPISPINVPDSKVFELVTGKSEGECDTTPNIRANH